MMKGRLTRRFGGALKSKTVGGVSTKHHDNPHVLKRASGGRCAEAGGAVAAPSLSRPARKMGGPVNQGSKNQGVMPKASSMPDIKRVEQGMDGKEKNRASGGKVNHTFPGVSDTKAGKAASGGRNLAEPGPQSKEPSKVMKMSPKKNLGLLSGLNKKDGTKNASGKTFATGGAVESDDDNDEDDSSSEEDEKLDEIEHEAEHRAKGGKVKRAAGGAAGTQSGKAAESSRFKEMEDSSKSYSLPSKGVMENMHDIGEAPKRMYQGREYRNQAQNASMSLDNIRKSDDPDSVFNGPAWSRKGGGKVKKK